MPGHTPPHLHVALFVLFASFVVPSPARAALRAGAYAQDVTPKEFPVLVNGNFAEGVATKANDRLHARAVVLDDGKEKIAIVVVDSCMLPRELLDDAKERAKKLTGIATDRMLISATHTHTAPSAMGCLGSDADPNYVKILPDLLARAIEQAHARLAPAKVGVTVIHDPDHTACRRWVFRPDRMRNDPFGELTVRATMHPGHLSPDAIGPTGPIDPGLSVLSIRHADGRPLALLANYSMHYVGTTPLSADYYGLFAAKIAKHLNADQGEGGFVGIMSQGTSGDMWLADYEKPKPEKRWDIDGFSTAIADEVAAAMKDVKYTDTAPLAMKETTLTLKRRLPDEKRLAWARARLAALGDKKPKTQPDVYAREAFFLRDDPVRELKLQAIRIGEIGITGIPNEVYALTGLKIKGQSPLPTTFNISLANGSEGYIPPPEQHKLGGYTTWPARTAGLEEQAEPKITEAVIKLLEDVSGQKRKSMDEPAGPYAKAVLASKPVAYYRMAETAGPTAADASGNGRNGTYEDGVLFHLPGPDSPAFTGDAKVPNRAAHFAGGRLLTSALELDPAFSPTYSIEFWVWNGMPTTVRPVTGVLYCGGIKDPKGFVDHLWIQGTAKQDQAGRLAIGQEHDFENPALVGKTILPLRSWCHVVVTLSKEGITRLYLNGQLEASGRTGVNLPPVAREMSFGGGHSQIDRSSLTQLEGKLDEIAFYDRALSADEIAAHFKASGMPPLTPLPPAAPKADSRPPSPAREDGAAPRASAPPRAGEVRGGGGEGQSQIANRKSQIPPRSPADSMKSFHLPPGWTVDLVAAEPLVASPVAIDWGADGKLWVVEMHDYPYGLDGKGQPGGKVKFLEDTDHDGQYDKATLFLDHLLMPTGVLPWRDGVLITAAPDILFARDTDHDGRADKIEKLYTGLASRNPQLRANGLRYGLDHWVHVANGWSAGVVTSAKTGEKLDLKGRDLRIRPDTGAMELTSGVSQWGREQDDLGRWFGTDNAHPLFHYPLEDRYLKRNPHVAFGDTKVQLLPLPLPPVYPRSPFAKRYIGLNHHGHFTSACGISVWRDEWAVGSGQSAVKTNAEPGTRNSEPPQDSALSTQRALHAFICEPVHNLIQHHVLTPNGATFTATRLDGQKGADFLAAEDPWFRPVMTRCAPDGTLWVVDMYRYMIEHPDWLNPEGKKALAPFYRDGADKGRLYRVRPKTVTPRPVPPLAEAPTPALIAALASPSGHTRDLAQRLLLWRHDPAALEPLQHLFTTTKNPLARLHALCTLAEMERQITNHKSQIANSQSQIANSQLQIANRKSQILRRALSDPHPALRAHALRLAEGRPDLLDAVTALTNDPDPTVRVQLACTLGAFDAPAAGAALAALALAHPADPILADAIASSAVPHEKALVARLRTAAGAPLSPLLLDRLATMAVARKDLETVAALAEDAPDDALARIADALAARGLSFDAWRQSTTDPWPARYARLRDRHARARQVVADAAADPARRLAAAGLLARFTDARAADLALVATLLTPRTPADLQLAAVKAAARTGDAAVPALLLADWPSHAPALRSAIADTLLSRAPWARALAEHPAAARQLDFARQQRLLNHADKSVKAAAQRTLAANATAQGDRQKVIDEYAPALTLSGDPARGQQLYNEHCATCHRDAGGAGNEIGPNLLTARDWPRENLLTAILDPDRTAEPRYLAYTATLADQTTLTGLVTSESAAGVTLKTLDNQSHEIPRANLKSLTTTGHSLMPQGFESALTPQDLANLIAHLTASQP